MRIGLYGMPTAGKTYILDRVNFMEVIAGSKFLRQFDPDFDKKTEAGREYDRREVAKIMMAKQDFIMDGHYAFGDEIVFTEEDGNLYDVFLYLYIDPDIILSRMQQSEKNRKYLKYDMKKWQLAEIEGLRSFCHEHNRDFYVIDNPVENCNEDANRIIDFLKSIKDGFSCVKAASMIAERILEESNETNITLLDGDKTLTVEDSSNQVFGYKTHIYDGNFYTGYQSWKQGLEFQNYIFPDLDGMPVHINNTVLRSIKKPAYILTSGQRKVWSYISEQLCLPFFCGVDMSAETKYFVTKFLQNAGKEVTAYGDGMNDYYMLLQADKGFLVTKPDGTVSKSLTGKKLEGLTLV